MSPLSDKKETRQEVFEAESFSFFASFRSAAMMIPRKNRADFYEAVIDFGLLGAEPDLSGMAAVLFTAIKPILERSRTKAKAAKIRWGGDKKGTNEKRCIYAHGNAEEDTHRNAEEGACINRNGMDSNGVERRGEDTRGSADAPTHDFDSVPGDDALMTDPETPPPISMKEAQDYAERSGMSREEGKNCWEYWQGRDWIVPNASHRMSREAAKVQVCRWKTRKKQFEAEDAKAGGYALRPDPDSKKNVAPRKGVPELTETAKGAIRSMQELYG